MSLVPHDVQCFDVERGLSKALGCKVETFVCGPTEYKFRIGQRWNLIVTEEQLGDLWNDTEQPSAMRETFDGLKGECLVFQSYQR